MQFTPSHRAVLNIFFHPHIYVYVFPVVISNISSFCLITETARFPETSCIKYITKEINNCLNAIIFN